MNTNKPMTVADIMRIATERAEARRKARESASEYSARDRAWFKRPLGALAMVLALAVGGSAHAAPRVDTPAVASAKREMLTAKAHLKDARAKERAVAKSQRATKRIAKLKAQIAKLEHPDLGCGPCVDNHDGSCTCEGK